VSADNLDWKIGDEIVIASTDFNGQNAEQRTIKLISIIADDTNPLITYPLITFEEPLLHKHYAGV
jgi:hypothetical protein